MLNQIRILSEKEIFRPPQTQEVVVSEHGTILREEMGFHFIAKLRYGITEESPIYELWKSPDQKAFAFTQERQTPFKLFQKLPPQISFTTIYADGSIIQTTNSPSIFSAIFTLVSFPGAGYEVSSFSKKDPSFLYERHLNRLAKIGREDTLLQHDSTELFLPIAFHLEELSEYQPFLFLFGNLGLLTLMLLEYLWIRSTLNIDFLLIGLLLLAEPRRGWIRQTVGRFPTKLRLSLGQILKKYRIFQPDFIEAMRETVQEENENFEPQRIEEELEINKLPQLSQIIQEELGFECLGQVAGDLILQGSSYTREMRQDYQYEVFGSPIHKATCVAFDLKLGEFITRPPNPKISFYTLFEDGTILQTATSGFSPYRSCPRAGFFVEYFQSINPKYLYQMHLEQIKRKRKGQPLPLHDTLEIQARIGKRLKHVFSALEQSQTFYPLLLGFLIIFYFVETLFFKSIQKLSLSLPVLGMYLFLIAWLGFQFSKWATRVRLKVPQES